MRSVHVHNLKTETKQFSRRSVEMKQIVFQTVTTFSTTYCLTRLITNTIFETAVTIAHCVLKQTRKTF